MPHRHNPNTPYCLTTEHGRAQSAAHSAHGAFLAQIVELALEDHNDSVSSELETLLDKAMAQLNPACITDDTLLADFANFQTELGVRDKEAFAPMVEAYIAERSAVRTDMQHLVNLIKSIRKLFYLQED